MQSVAGDKRSKYIYLAIVGHTPPKKGFILPTTTKKNCTKNFLFDTMSPSWESWVTKYLQPEMDAVDGILKAEEKNISQSQRRDRLAWRKGKGCRWVARLDSRSSVHACHLMHAKYKLDFPYL